MAKIASAKRIPRDAEKHFELQLLGYRLATAEIIYRLPDYQDILQTYIWQEYDMPPKYPVLRGFLDFWEGNLEGPLYQVRVACKQFIRPSDIRYVDGEMIVN